MKWKKKYLVFKDFTVAMIKQQQTLVFRPQ